MTGLLVNIDVDDLERGIAFCCEGLGLETGRRFNARLGSPVRASAWGRLALLADPFGHGFCLTRQG